MLTVSCSVKLPTSSIYITDTNTNEFIQWPEIIDEDDNQRVRLTPLENVDQMLLFEVEVTNKNQDSLYINPQSWQLDYLSMEYDKSFSSIGSASYPLSGSEINESYQNIAKRIVDARNGTTALVIVGIVVVIAVVILVASTTSSKNKKDKKDRKKRANTGFIAAMNFTFNSNSTPETDEWTNKQKIAYFRKRGELLQNVYFGPRAILKGETCVFVLYFHRKESISHLQLNGVVGDQDYSWKFQHNTEDMTKVN